MKKRDVVTDELGNHYAVLKMDGSQATVCCVATKEVFTVPESKLTVVPGLRER